MNIKFFTSVLRKVILLTLLIVSIIYYGDASRRAAAKNWESQLSTEDKGIYTAQYTYLTSEIMLIRLYQTGQDEILAERTFDHSDIPRVFWTKDCLVYDTNDSSLFYDGGINLPPTWIDRFLAQLP